MKYIIAILGGWILGAVTIVFTNHVNDSSGSIHINVENDTNITFSLITLQVESAQRFTCTLHYNKCSFVVAHLGDTNFELQATKEGETSPSLHYSVGYAESGSALVINLSQFNKNGT